LDVRVPFIMRLTEQAAIPLAERWMRRPLRHKRLPSLLVGVAISCGQTNLEQGELYSLRVGDAIRLDAASDLNHPHQLIVRDCVIAVASLAGSKVTVGRLLAKAFLENRGMAMTFNNSDSVADPLVSVGSLSNLQVPVRFEVGRIDLPLSELETMGAGYVFELGRTPVGIVDIVAGGRWIGRGELIDVDGRSAVRLLSLTK